MRLGLSSEAAPGLALAELAAAGARRGLACLELVSGDGHGVAPFVEAHAIRSLAGVASAGGLEVVAFRAAGGREAGSAAAARLSAALGAPVAAPRGAVAPDEVGALARLYADEGGSLLLTHGSDPDEALALRRATDGAPAGSVGLAWEVRPGAEDPEDARGVLDAAGPLLRLVRLHGGGPESAAQEGQGVGALMARLALGRYAGPLILAPSTPAYGRAWSAWLGRSGGWGCGSKQRDDALVVLSNT
jgi:hypothetical protein